MKNALNAWIECCRAIADSIREVGSIPSGHLYAAVQGSISIDRYQRAIQTLVDAKLVRRDSSHLLTWIGPKAPTG